MHILFYHIYCWVQRNKFLSVGIAFLFLFFFGFLGSKIRFEEDITQIIPKSEKSDLTTKAIRQINFSDKITVLIEKKDKGSLDDLLSVAQQLSDTLSLDTTHVKEVSGQFESQDMSAVYDFVYDNIPLFLEANDYDSLATKISKKYIQEKAKSNYETLMSPSGFVLGEFIQKDPLGFAVLGLQKLQRASVGDNFILHEGFITSKDSSQILLFVAPKYEGNETEKNEAFAHALYTVRDSLNTAYKDRAEVSYFGSALVAVANADQIKSDILKTIIISMSVLMILLVLFYRKIYIPLLVFIPTIFSAVFALGCLYLYKPVISAISLSVGAVLIGITIDYALHILTHFKKNSDVKELYKQLTKPLLMSGTTNAVAFLCLLFVNSTALVDLGIFASITLVSSAVFTLLIIPHLYQAKKELKHNSWLDKLAAFPFERSKILIGACILLIIGSLFTSHKVQFNNDLAGLNYMPEELAETEKRLDKLTNTTAKSLYVVATGDSVEQALQVNDDITRYLEGAKNKNAIIEYSGVGEILKPRRTQEARIGDWNAFWSYHNKDKLKNDVLNASRQFDFTDDAHQTFYMLLEKDFYPLDLVDFEELPNIGIREFVVERNGFYTISSLVKLDESQRNEVVSTLEKIPGVVVVDRKQLNETFLGKLKDDFNALISYSSIAVLLILWLFFRRVELVLLAAIPIGLTGLVTAGLMGVFGLEFNIFSAIVCTLIFGHGVDFSIFMTAALQKQYSSGKDELHIFRTSILLAVLTTVLAIGALIFAKHPALISISSVSLIGVFAAVLITFVFYPIIFRFFISDRAQQGKSPHTIVILFWSIVLFVYYGLGCIVFSFVARFIFPILPFDRDKKDKVLRRMLAGFMKSVLYWHPLVKNKTINPNQETFEKPAVIIGNHASFLDTLSMGMLVPKMVFLVNDWVWKSPIFGKAVQSLGFYPVSNGVEGSLEVLKDKVKQGYSIVVFPEGTRSVDNHPKRFHKGAFYLAEELKLDIIPIYLHGNGDVLPKGDISIFPGKLTPVIGDRILYSDRSLGANYTERTKKISRYFKEQYESCRLQLEDENYFIKKIEIAYLYKDDEVVESVKKSLAKWKHTFYALNKKGLLSEHVIHWGHSYGELDYLLSLQQAKRKVVGCLSEEEHVQVAESIYWKQQRSIKFVTTLLEATQLIVTKELGDRIGLESKNSLYSSIVNLNNANDFSYLLSNGYLLSYKENGIEIYSKYDTNE